MLLAACLLAAKMLHTLDSLKSCTSITPMTCCRDDITSPVTQRDGEGTVHADGTLVSATEQLELR
jgi:hypothetical protein